MKYKKWTLALGRLGLISEESAITADQHDNRSRMTELENRVNTMEKQLAELESMPIIGQ